jgi:putative glutamine amidotransferase
MAQSHPNHPRRPLVAITSDLMSRKDRPTAYLTMTYAQSVLDAGGMPVILPPTPGHVDDLIARFDGFILSGGDDPRTEPFGHPTHPEAVPVLEDRQSFEMELIGELDRHPEIPVLGICLGMQMLVLCAGGTLNQHLPDTHESHAIHWDHEHEIISAYPEQIASGAVWSGHRQAISEPGSFRVLASSLDGVIEAIDDPNRKFMLGIQWHPERTADRNLGQGLFDRLVQASK